MYYSRFTKVIVDYFMAKDQATLRKNKMFWHYARDDFMFTTIRVISKHKDTQEYGAILPQYLTNQAMLESEAFKTYRAYATGEKAPKSKATKKKTDSGSSPKTKPSQASKGKRIKTSAKGDKPAITKSKGLTILFEVALSETEQIKLATKRSLKEFHISYASGSGDGVDILSKVPDAQQQTGSGTNEGAGDKPESVVELEYHLEDVFKATNDHLDWHNLEGRPYPYDRSKPLPSILDARGRLIIPYDHFINNDLEYLKGGSSSRKYTTSITKTKAADYSHIKWIEDKIPRSTWSERFYGYATNMETSKDVYSKHRIIVVTSLKIMEFFSYKHLEEITVQRQDDKLYKFREGDFKRLRHEDIEDMLRFALNVALRMYTRCIVIQERVEDLQLAVESYQKKINLTKPDTYRIDISKKTPYTAYHDIQGNIYQDDMNRYRLLRTDEVHKFSDDGKLTNLNVDERFALNVALRMYTRRITSVKRLHILLTVISKALSIKIDMNRNCLMRTDELHKFSDGTLNHVCTSLNDIATGIQMKYFPKRKWSKQDKQRARVMIKAIDKKLKDRRLMRSLEKFVKSFDPQGFEGNFKVDGVNNDYSWTHKILATRLPDDNHKDIMKAYTKSFRHSDTERLSRSDEVLKLKNFKKYSTLKLFKSTQIKKGMRVMTVQKFKFTDGKAYMMAIEIMLVDDITVYKITYLTYKSR
ncbi:hypothetical protein Tco_0814458 [Tanacetum coccineum]